MKDAPFQKVPTKSEGRKKSKREKHKTPSDRKYTIKLYKKEKEEAAALNFKGERQNNVKHNIS